MYYEDTRMQLCRYSEKVHLHVQSKVDNNTNYFKSITAMKNIMYITIDNINCISLFTPNQEFVVIT